MQILLCTAVFVAVISGVVSRSPVHSSPRYGGFFSRSRTNMISALRPTGVHNRICSYGRFKRDCCPGWRRNAQGDCEPVCTISCGPHGTCVAPPRRCKCQPGWVGDFCEKDTNECAVIPCQHRCMNTVGSYKCYCDNGYYLQEDGKTCSRDDRCNPTRCHYGCVQHTDGFKCFCPNGLALTTDGLGCEDIDECATGEAQCPRGRRCKNTYGNFLCLCPEGYKFQYVAGSLTCVVGQSENDADYNGRSDIDLELIAASGI